MKITCDGQIESGVVDYIELEHYGVLRVVGWSLKPAEALSVTLSQEGLEQSREPDSRYRTLRHDVVVSGAGHDPLVGFMYEFIGGFGNSEMVVTVDNFSRRIEASEVACLSRVVPHYQTLLSTDRVLHREDIYGSGPPIGNVSPDVLTLAKRLEPPVLDFGCGAGALVTELRRNGVEAYGIEVDRHPIREALAPEAIEFVTLYDGQFPLPFETSRFNSVIASEVIEHVIEYEKALQEIARVTKTFFTMTVPDISSIPVCYQHGVVPWHLLERSHYNFFNGNSLTLLLKKAFRTVELGRIGHGQVNGRFVPGSLFAMCKNSEGVVAC